MQGEKRISKQTEEIKDKCPYTGSKCFKGKKNIETSHPKCICHIKRNYYRNKLMAELEEKIRNNEPLDYQGDNPENWR